MKPVLISLIALGVFARTLPAAAQSVTPQKKTVTVVAFGDSITAGATVSGAEAWPSLLQVALQKRFPNCLIKVINAGVGGNTSREGLARIDHDVLEHAPDFVLVEFGNDCTFGAARHVPIGEYTNNLAIIRAKVAERSHGRTILLTFPPLLDQFVGSRNDEYYKVHKTGPDALQGTYRDAMRQFAKQQGLPLIDADKAVRQQMAGHKPGEYTQPSDGVHLTAKGNRVVADAALVVMGAEIQKFLSPGGAAPGR